MKKYLSNKTFLFEKAIVYSFIISLFYIFFLSYSTSPLFPGFFGYDSAQFQFLGKCWVNGIIPPIDIFDHKGPFIFFINAVGFFLTKNPLGIFFIQIIFLSLTIYIFSKILNFYIGNNSFNFQIIILVLIYFGVAYEGGNLTEEYCLPLISISVYLQVIYLYNNDKNEHNILHSFIYGTTFGICACTRITNSIMVCSGVAVIALLLIKKKLFKNLFLNIVLFFAGFFTFCMPFLIYYYIHGSLYEMFYCAILANIEYKLTLVPWIAHATTKQVLKYLDFFGPSYFFLFICLSLFRRKKYSLVCYYLLTTILETYLFLTSQFFYHYAIITMPQLLLCIAEIVYIRNEQNISCKKLNTLCIIFCCIFFWFLLSNIDRIKSSSLKIYDAYCNQKYGYEELIRHVNRSDPFVVYGGNTLVHFYIKNNYYSCYRYYILQEWQSSSNVNIKNDIKKLYGTCKAKWILSDNKIDNIKDILNSRYILFSKTKDFKLWKLKE